MIIPFLTACALALCLAGAVAPPDAVAQTYSPSNATVTTHTATTTSSQLLAANVLRLGLVVANPGAGTAYVVCGVGPASTTLYTFPIPPGASVNLPFVWLGPIQVVYSSGSQALTVTELTQ